MAQLMDYAGYLAKEIGPRPAGTEEEQQAALYITEQIQKEAGFAASIEEFSSSSNYELSRAILALVVIVVTILAIIFPVLSIPAFILAAAAAAVYALEAFDRPIISQIMPRGASQNVIAKYQPAFDGAEHPGGARTRSRKVVLVAHYDTGRVKPALVERAESLSLPLPLICVVAMIAAAFFALLRIFMASGGGMGLLVLNILTIIALLLCALPVARALLMRSAPYNEGANNNATGTAALIEVARRISRGSVSEADLAQEADVDLHIHGEAAAREAGLIPEGAQIRYEAEQLVPPSELGEHDEEERLLAAKAAIAALTGKPVERRVYGSVADKLVNSFADEADAAYVEPGDYPASTASNEPSYVGAAPAAQAMPGVAASPAGAGAAGSADGFENAPSWFIAAQKNAKRSDDASEPAQVQRSKYTEAMEYAERERADRAEEERAAEQARRDAELRAREQEARAAIEASAQAAPELEGPADVVFEPEAVSAEQGGSAAVAGLAPADDAPQASGAAPDSTIAMSAHVPAAEIAAEVAAADAAEALAAAPADPAASPVPAPAESPADAIPVITHEPVVRERITSLPSIDPAAPAGAGSTQGPATVSSPSRSGMLRKLRTNVPSLSGLIAPVKAGDANQADAARPASDGASAASSTPNTAAAAANRAAARRAAADSVPSVVKVPTPAPDPAPEPVDYNMEVPRSRAGSILGRLRRDDPEELTDTPQEWLNVDEDFEARNVGRERGSWESFRDDQYFDDDDEFDDFGTGDEPRTRRRWQGGAYSRTQLGHVDMRSGVDSDADSVVPENLPADEIDPALTGEIEQIYHFRNPQFNTEVWFVAIGSDNDGHDGARAFLAEHADELRGSMVIEVESLGAGALSVATEEGRVRKIAASSRVKRYTRGAVSATGIALDEVSLAGSDSIASVVQKAGFQSMHLFGAENGRPALKGSADDVLENIDELLFDDHVNFVYELLKH